MTRQCPERILIAGKPGLLFSDPLASIMVSRGRDHTFCHWTSTACWRGYIGTWEIVGGRLWLVTLCTGDCHQETPLSDAEYRRLLCILEAKRLPAPADRFSGRLRIPVGGLFWTSATGWCDQYEGLRVVTMHAGVTVRDRLVDTRAILLRRLRREMRQVTELGRGSGPDALHVQQQLERIAHPREPAWIEDWWPPGWPFG